MGQCLCDLFAGQTVFDHATKIQIELIVVSHRGACGDGHQASIARTEIGPAPEVVEYDVVGQLHEFRRDGPQFLRDSLGSGRLVDAIVEGVSAASVKDKILCLGSRKADLVASLRAAETRPAVLGHPSVANLYREKIETLHTLLARDESRTEAAEIIRTLVQEIVLTPVDGELQALSKGDLAGVLAAQNNKRPSAPDDLMDE
jgi:hypothetical protein